MVDLLGNQLHNKGLKHTLLLASDGHSLQFSILIQVRKIYNLGNYKECDKPNPLKVKVIFSLNIVHYY